MTPSARDGTRDVALFVLLLLTFSSGFYGFVLLVPGAREQWLSLSPAFMWCPGIAALVTQLVRHRSLRGLGWGRGGAKYYLVAYVLPLTFCVPVYLLVWLLGVGSLDLEPLEAARARLRLPAGLVGGLSLALAAALVAPAGIVATLGEELGWRGFLVPRLAALTSPVKTSLLTGALWSLWHYPIVWAVLPVFLPRLPLWYATTCFTTSVVAISFVYTWLRLRSGSVWPAALLHATSNAFQAYFQGLTREGEWTAYVTYEYGIGFALVIPFVALPFWRSLRRGQPA